MTHNEQQEVDLGEPKMNRTWIVVGYDTAPSALRQKQVSERLYAITQPLFPESTIEMETGGGSWWVAIALVCGPAGLWLLKVVCGWGVTEVLNTMRERRNRLNASPKKDDGRVTMRDQVYRRGEDPLLSLDAKLNEYVLLARELAQDDPPLRLLNLAEWNDERQEGILLQFRLYERTDAMNIVRCQNLDDLQKLMRP